MNAAWLDATLLGPVRGPHPWHGRCTIALALHRPRRFPILERYIRSFSHSTLPLRTAAAVIALLLAACGDDDGGVADMGTGDGSVRDASLADAAPDDLGLGECPDPIVVDDDIEEATEWSATHRLGCVDYRVTAPLRVSAALTIEPAVEIELAEGAGLTTAEDGSLSAVGTTAEPIVFTGANPVPGHWEALRFTTDRSANELRHVVVEHGGRGEDFAFFENIPANVIVADGGRLSLRDSTLRLAGEHGLFLQDGATVSDYTENVFADNGGTPIRLPSNQVGVLDGTSAFADNGESHIEVVASTVAQAQTWPSTTVPLRFFGKHFVQLPIATDAVTIEAGTVIELAPQAGIKVREGGLSAVGTLRPGPTSTCPIASSTSTTSRWTRRPMPSPSMPAWRSSSAMALG